MKNYIATGRVYGKYWGGGEGAYPCVRIEALTKQEIIKKAKKGLSEGWLDSGMGYEKLIGACLEIEEIETITKEGKEFKRSEFTTEFIGKLNDAQKDFLIGLDIPY